MPIKWYNQNSADNTWSEDGETHHGMMTGNTTYKCERVMSDIYADAYYAETLDITTGTFSWVRTGTAFECDTRKGKVVADVFPEGVVEAFRMVKEAKEKMEEAKEEALRSSERNKNEARLLRRGKFVRVARGRKIAVGTEGLFVESISTKFGNQAKVLTWDGQTILVSTSNLDVIIPGTWQGSDPAEGWSALCRHQEKVLSTWLDQTPKKGNQVKDKNGNIGIVFWTGNGRIGFKAPNSSDAIWASERDVEVLDEGAKNNRFPIFGESPLKDLPDPFCKIYKIYKNVAYSNQGEAIMALPDAASVKSLSEKLPKWG